MGNWLGRHWPKIVFAAWAALLAAYLGGLLGRDHGPRLDPRTGDAPVPGLDFPPPAGR